MPVRIEYRKVLQVKPNNGQYDDMEQLPEIGDKIYVPTALYVYRGADDFQGGMATVCTVKEGISAGRPTLFVYVRENPTTGYNWQCLEKEQEKLRERFGDTVAHPDPDYRPEFNCPDADWKPV